MNAFAPARRRFWPLGASAAALVILAVGAVWLERGPIAGRLARDWLAGRGVAAGLTVRSISLTGLTASLRLGDPADPDLSIDRLDVSYAVTGPWNGRAFGLQTGSLRLQHPRLKLRLTDKGVDFGSLKPLIDQLLKLPATGPLPDVEVDDGEVRLLAPGGGVRLAGGLVFQAGELERLDALIDRYTVTLAGTKIAGDGGTVRLRGHGPRLTADLDLGPLSLAQGLAGGRASGARLEADLPYPTLTGQLSGPARLVLTADGLGADADAATLTDGQVRGELDGELEAGRASQRLDGGLDMTVRAGQAVQGALRARDAIIKASLTRLTMIHGAQGVSLTGEGSLAASGKAGSNGLDISARTVGAVIRGLSLTEKKGRLIASAGLAGGLVGEGAMTADAARRAVAPLAGAPASAQAAEKALRGFRFEAARWQAEIGGVGSRLDLTAPVSVDSASGARLTLTPIAGGLAFGATGASGAAALALNGGGLPTLAVQAVNIAASSRSQRADIALRVSLDSPPVQGGQLALAGRLSAASGRLRYDLAGCQDQTVKRLALPNNPVDNLAVKLCPATGPLLAAGPAGWKVQARLGDAAADVPASAIRVRGAAGAFSAAGEGSASTTAFVLDRATIIDAADPTRFKPLTLSGRADLAGGAITGAFAAASRSGHRLALVSLRHDLAGGAGRAEIDASGLTFAPAGLQPADLAGALAGLRDANGQVSFRGWFAWAAKGPLESGGALAAHDLRFISPLGQVLGLDTDLTFTSLVPLVTAPGQMIKIGEIDTVTPLSKLSARFDLGAEKISIDGAQGGVAHGHIRLEPTSASLSPNATLKGVLVVDHVNLGEIIAASSLAGSIKLDAVVDGRLPFALGPSGLTLDQGHIAAVKPGRLSIARQALTGGAPAAKAQSAGQNQFAQDLAYQAMEDLAFDQLDATLNTLPGDRLGILFHIKGRHDPPKPARATIAVADLMRGKAMAKPLTLPSNTPINLTLDTSLNFGELVRALQQAWAESLGQARPGSPPVHPGDASVNTQ